MSATADESAKAQSAWKDVAPADPKISSLTSPSPSRPSRAFMSTFSGTFASMEYRGIGTSVTNNTSDPPSAISHVIVVDPPAKSKPAAPAVPQPDAPLREVRDFLTIFFLEKFPCSEAEASGYARLFESDPTLATYTDGLSALYLYSYARRQLREIFDRSVPSKVGEEIYELL
ncbi:MAG: hypothetical protein Q9213_007244 [Squamulea squamosa]